MPYRLDHSIQALIVLAVMFVLPGALQLPGYWSGAAFIAMGLVFSAWAFYRASVHGRGPLW
jgi:hypothetical protein